jgi:hypothetical protein
MARSLENMKRFGFRLDPSDVHSQIEAQRRELSAILDTIRLETWDEDLNILYDEIITNRSHHSPIEQFSYAFAFGCGLGSEVAKILDGSKEEVEQAGALSGLFNLGISLFDNICDSVGDPDLVRRLLQIVNVQKLRYELGRRTGSTERRAFETSPTDPVLVRMLCLLIREYFRRYRLLTVHRELCGIELKNSIIRLYEAELNGLNCTFDSRKSSQWIYRTLSTKSGLPMWTICLNSMMCVRSGAPGITPVLRRIMRGIGDAIWIADDLSDAISDLDNRRWSYVWLDFASRIEPKLLKDVAVEAQWELTALESLLATTDTIHHVANEMCVSLANSLSLLRSDYRGTEELEHLLLVGINNWLA